MSKVWLITGASRGLGRSFTQEALKAGHRVVATARNAERLAEVASKFGESDDGTDPDTLGGHVEDRGPVTPCVPERCASVARKNCQKGASTAKKRESVPVGRARP